MVSRCVSAKFLTFLRTFCTFSVFDILYYFNDSYTALILGLFGLEWAAIARFCLRAASVIKAPCRESNV